MYIIVFPYVFGNVWYRKVLLASDNSVITLSNTGSHIMKMSVKCLLINLQNRGFCCSKTGCGDRCLNTTPLRQKTK